MANLQTLQTSRYLGTWLTRRKQAQKRFTVASLMLTPMVDMFSLLVIFLLQFFSATPEFQLTSDVRLPTSISSTEMAVSPTVSVSLTDIYVDHTLVGTLKDVMKNPAPLSDALLKSRQKWVTEHPNEEFLGTVNLEAHQEVDSTTVAQVMTVLSAHHFGSINLMAIGGG